MNLDFSDLIPGFTDLEKREVQELENKDFIIKFKQVSGPGSKNFGGLESGVMSGGDIVVHIDGGLASGGNGVCGLHHYDYTSLMEVLLKSFEGAYWTCKEFSPEATMCSMGHMQCRVQHGIPEGDPNDLQDICWRNVFAWFNDVSGLGLLTCTLTWSVQSRIGYWARFYREWWTAFRVNSPYSSQSFFHLLQNLYIWDAENDIISVYPEISVKLRDTECEDVKIFTLYLESENRVEIEFEVRRKVERTLQNNAALAVLKNLRARGTEDDLKIPNCCIQRLKTLRAHRDWIDSGKESITR